MHTVETGTRIALKNVMFATDFSPCSNAALRYAVSIARRHAAALHAVHVLPSDGDMVFVSPENWSVALDEQERWKKIHIDELEKALQGLTHEVLTPKGKIPDELAKIVAEKQIDMLVLGTHGRTGVRKLLVGSVAEAVFRGATCPVMSVGPNVCSDPDGDAQFKHIVFATDFSEDSLAALPYAISLAEEDQARLTLLHVVNQPRAGVMHSDDAKHRMEQHLQELVPADDYPWCEPEYLVEFSRQFGPPGERILEVAKEHGADLIVVGVRRLHGTGSTVTHLTPTTAQYVVAHAECPVLTVRG